VWSLQGRSAAQHASAGRQNASGWQSGRINGVRTCVFTLIPRK
jgi:hypothetical protein